MSWQAFPIRCVLEPRHPAANLGEAPFALLVRIEHKHRSQVFQLQPVEISRAANKKYAKFGESFPIIVVMVHSHSSIYVDASYPSAGLAVMGFNPTW